MNAKVIDLVVAAMKFIPGPQAKVDCLLNILRDERLSLSVEETRDFLAVVGKEHFCYDPFLFCALISKRLKMVEWPNGTLDNLEKALISYLCISNSEKVVSKETVFNELAQEDLEGLLRNNCENA